MLGDIIYGKCILRTMWQKNNNRANFCQSCGKKLQKDGCVVKNNKACDEKEFIIAETKLKIKYLKYF